MANNSWLTQRVLILVQEVCQKCQPHAFQCIQASLYYLTDIQVCCTREVCQISSTTYICTRTGEWLKGFHDNTHISSKCGFNGVCFWTQGGPLCTHYMDYTHRHTHLYIPNTHQIGANLAVHKVHNKPTHTPCPYHKPCRYTHPY